MREPHEFEVPLCAQVGGDLFFPDQENEGKLVRINIAAAKSVPFVTIRLYSSFSPSSKALVASTPLAK